MNHTPVVRLDVVEWLDDFSVELQEA